jgi:hypothetical protein
MLSGIGALNVIEWVPDPVSTYRLLVDVAEACRDNQTNLSIADPALTTGPEM